MNSLFPNFISLHNKWLNNEHRKGARVSRSVNILMQSIAQSNEGQNALTNRKRGLPVSISACDSDRKLPTVNKSESKKSNRINILGIRYTAAENYHCSWRSPLQLKVSSAAEGQQCSWGSALQLKVSTAAEGKQCSWGSTMQQKASNAAESQQCSWKPAMQLKASNAAESQQCRYMQLKQFLAEIIYKQHGLTKI